MLLKLTIAALFVAGASAQVERWYWPPGWGDPPPHGKCKNTKKDNSDWVDYGCYHGYPACKAPYSSTGHAHSGHTCCQDWYWKTPCIDLEPCYDTNDGPGEDPSCHHYTYRRRCDPLFGEGYEGNYCYYCKNNRPEGEVDLGCSKKEPNCYARKLHYGDKCFFCVNDEMVGVPDTGCTDYDEPNCVADDGDYGYSCEFQCLNNEPDSGIPDKGCEKYCVSPDCVGDKINCHADLDEIGYKCVDECWNNIKLNKPKTPDSGCTEDKPVCLADPDKYGTECAVCINDIIGGRDTGCPKSHPVCACSEGHNTCDAVNQDGEGDICMKCQNTRESDINDWYADEGCGNDKKVCNSHGEYSFGNKCRVCVDDHGPGEVDSGCDERHPHCLGTDQGKFGDSCGGNPVTPKPTPKPTPRPTPKPTPKPTPRPPTPDPPPTPIPPTPIPPTPQPPTPIPPTPEPPSPAPPVEEKGKSRRRRRLLTTATVAEPGDELYVQHFTACSGFDYNVEFYVDPDTHMYAIGYPQKTGASAGCPMVATHVVLATETTPARKELLGWEDVDQGLSMFVDKGRLSMGSFKLHELERAFQAAKPDATGGVYDVVTNNCASYMASLAEELGVPVGPRVTGFVASRLLENSVSDLGQQIRNSLHFSDLFETSVRRGSDGLSNEELVTMLVDHGARHA